MDNRQRGWLVEERLTRSVIGAFFHVYNRLGFGFLEAPYCLAMERTLTKRGHRVGREVAVRLFFEGEELAQQYRLDMVVDDTLVVEIKAGYQLHPAATRQVYNYLRATNLEVALLRHFGPEPRFYRLYSPNRSHPAHPILPQHLDSRA